MFMHLFKGLGSSQNWMFSDTATPEKLVSKYVGYEFGNAYNTSEPRRVVLNEAMLQNKIFPLDAVSARVKTTMKHDFP